jgi:hypothetical protein
LRRSFRCCVSFAEPFTQDTIDDHRDDQSVRNEKGNPENERWNPRSPVGRRKQPSEEKRCSNANREDERRDYENLDRRESTSSVWHFVTLFLHDERLQSPELARVSFHLRSGTIANSGALHCSALLDGWSELSIDDCYQTFHHGFLRFVVGSICGGPPATK